MLAIRLLLYGLELRQAQLVLLQKFVEFIPVGLFNTGNLGNIAIGHL